MQERVGPPASWAGRSVEVLIGPGCGRGWWYFAGELEARNAAAVATGREPGYHRVGRRYLDHPNHQGVRGAVWTEVPPS